ncbi:hypothetical protein GCM10020256_68990 [Streptomyces thermocoprophilus]
MYSCGETDLPVWPTWLVCGYQPASTAAREAPTAAPSSSARASMIAKFSAPLTPRPPETTIAASVSSGRPVDSRGVRPVIRVPVALSEKVTDSASTAPAAGAASTAALFGLTVMTGVPLETRDLVVKDAANTDWVATGPSSPASRSTASVMMPEPMRSARRAAISLPSAEDGTSTAAGETCSTAACRASTFGTTRYSAYSDASWVRTFTAPCSASAAAVSAAPLPRATATGSPMRRARVSSSRVGLRTAPSTWST